jgi:hypothetical protein
MNGYFGPSMQFQNIGFKISNGTSTALIMQKKRDVLTLNGILICEQ